MNNFPHKLDHLCFNHPNILEIIRDSSFLYLFLTLYKLRGEISDIDLLNNYMAKTITKLLDFQIKYLIITTLQDLKVVILQHSLGSRMPDHYLQRVKRKKPLIIMIQ